MHILLVEDEPKIVRSLVRRLNASGFVADCAASIGEALEALEARDYPAVLLDRRLPDGDGVSAMSQMRRLRPGVRILILSALSNPGERVRGLDAGADDYLTKRVTGEEMLARLRASLRRPGGEPQPRVVVGDLGFDLDACEAFVGERPLVLQRRELRLLAVLMQRVGRAVTLSTLIEEVYGFQAAIQDDALRMLVSRLRQRLEEAGAGVDIHTARGIGYMLTKAAR